MALHRGGPPARAAVTRRFYVEPALDGSDEIRIGGALARRIATVLRLRAGEEIVLFDGSGADVRVRIEQVSARAVEARVIGRAPAPPEPHVRINLYQSITKGERFEWLLEKATEIGVARVVPLIAARSVVRTSAEAARRERWSRIVVEASEQCGRGSVPEVDAPQDLERALASAPGILIVPYEEAGDAAPNIHAAFDAQIDALFALAAVSVFIGPEGGFEASEVERAEAAGAARVTLGPRILRSETAGLVAATLAMHAIGELG